MSFLKTFFLIVIFAWVGVLWYSKYDILIDDGSWPFYQCVINLDNSDENCKNQRWIWHMCQIYDHSFDWSGIPNMCYDFCLPRSWANENCAIVSVEETINQEAHERPAAKYIWLYQSIRYEWVSFTKKEETIEEENEQEVEELELSNTEEKPIKKECELDSDCKDYCDWSKIIDMYCHNNTYKCTKWKETDCSTQEEIFENYSFTKTCNNKLSCEIDKSLLKAKNQEIGDELKKYNNALTETSKLRQKFQLECEKWVILVSTKLVSDTSILLLTYSTSLLDLIFDTAWKLIEEWLNNLTSDSTKMTPDEYVVWACSTRNYLENQENLFHKKISELVDLSKTFRNKVGSITNQ